MSPKASLSEPRCRPSPEGGLFGAETLWKRDSDVRNRTNEYYSLVYLLDGGGFYEDPINKRSRVYKGNVLVLFPGMRHSYVRMDFPVWSESVLTFGGRIFKYLEEEGLLDRSRPVLYPGLVPGLRKNFDSLIHDFIKNRLSSNSVVTAKIHLLLTEILNLHQANEGDRIADFVKQACHRLDQDLGSELDMEETGRKLGLSYERFRKIFMKYVGFPPVRYRVLRRIESARSALTQSNQPIKQIAESLGYSNLSFFYRQFKQVTGKTPDHFKVPG